MVYFQKVVNLFQRDMFGTLVILVQRALSDLHGCGEFRVSDIAQILSVSDLAPNFLVKGDSRHFPHKQPLLPRLNRFMK